MTGLHRFQINFLEVSWQNQENYFESDIFAGHTFLMLWK